MWCVINGRALSSGTMFIVPDEIFDPAKAPSFDLLGLSGTMFIVPDRNLDFMSDRDSRKAKMSVFEKETRARLLELAGGGGLMRGTLTIREKTCGKDTCKCARGN